MSITTALEARRDALRDREAGFTLIELLVVVIIIGILAAIAIPVYLGVQNNAKDSSVKNDLTNARTAIITAGTDNNGLLPTAITDDATGTATLSTGSVPLKTYGWSFGTPNTTNLKYVFGDQAKGTWCVLGIGITGNRFSVSSATAGVKAEGTTLAACTPPTTN